MCSDTETDLLLKGGLLTDGGTADILIRDGKFAEISKGLAAPEGVREIDVSGRLVSPGLVNGHVHLDKTLLGAPWIPHVDGGSIAERIAAEKKSAHASTRPSDRRISRGCSRPRKRS